MKQERPVTCRIEWEDWIMTMVAAGMAACSSRSIQRSIHKAELAVRLDEVRLWATS
jgi:hypothetical protein